MQAILQLFRTIETILPPEVYVPLFVVIGIAAVPTWIYWLRTKQIRGQLRGLLRSKDPGAREAHRRQAFEFAANKPRRLAYLAEEALRIGLKPIHDEAVEALKAAGQHDQSKRLELAAKPPPQRGAHPLEEAVVIERMVAEGLVDAARTRLREVREKFPDDPDLVELERRLSDNGAHSA